MVSYPTVNSYQVKIGDFNGDGRMDVAGINWGCHGDDLDVFLQTAAGTLASPVTYHVPTAATTSSSRATSTAMVGPISS